MPRRNGRRADTGGDGAALRRIEAEMHRRQAERTTAPGVRVRHKAHCDESQVNTFTGTRGDLMARCHTCGATTLVQLHPLNQGETA